MESLVVEVTVEPNVIVLKAFENSFRRFVGPPSLADWAGDDGGWHESRLGETRVELLTACGVHVE